MLSVDEALTLVLREAEPSRPAPVVLDDALGLVLAEDVVSEVDSPPFDKALMDGFAVRAADVPDGTGELRVVEVVIAGRVPQRPVGAGEATRIMTGAPLPEGADSVVKIEECTIDPHRESVRIAAAPFKPGTYVMSRGAALRRGEAVLPAGRLLRPQELGALAELGRHALPVRRRPRVAVLATGDELVPVDQTPGPGQIRNSNETMLCAQIRRAGGVPVPLGIAQDERSVLRERIEAGLRYDVLLLSGGVSEGTLDLVPSELQALGVRQVFHKVNVKPGKPLWYGIKELHSRGVDPGSFPPAVDIALQAAGAFGYGTIDLDAVEVDSIVLSRLPESTAYEIPAFPVAVDGEAITVAVSDIMNFDALDKLRFVVNRDLRFVVAEKAAILRAVDRHYGRSCPSPRCHVFGLPGNPVSSMVCFELFARPAIRRLLGLEPAAPQPIRARLAADHVARGDRPTYHPARLDWTETGPVVRPVAWLGSADLRATVDANAMALFSAGDATYRAGEAVTVFEWD